MVPDKTLKSYLEEHYSAKSIPIYLNQINQFKAHVGSQVEATTYSDVVTYIGYLRSRKLHPKTLRNHLFAIKIYFNYLLAVGHRPDHPCQKLKLKDQLNRSIEVENLYSPESLEELYQTFETPLDKRTKTDKPETIKKRDKIMLSLLIYQALTSLEITEIRVEDIDLEEGTIKIRDNDHPGRRGNKGRTLAMKPKQVLLFNDYLKNHCKSLWRKQTYRKRVGYFILTGNGLQMWGNYINIMLSKDRAPNEVFKPFKIRQSVIAHLLKENKDLRIVQEFAGHRKTGSTEAYQRTGLAELKASIEKLHPHQG